MFGWLRRRKLRRVVVHTTAGESFEGNLLTSARDGVVLVACRMHDDEGAVDLAGDVFVPREQVRFVQVTHTA